MNITLEQLTNFIVIEADEYEIVMYDDDVGDYVDAIYFYEHGRERNLTDCLRDIDDKHREWLWHDVLYMEITDESQLRIELSKY